MSCGLWDQCRFCTAEQIAKLTRPPPNFNKNEQDRTGGSWIMFIISRKEPYSDCCCCSSFRKRTVIYKPPKSNPPPTDPTGRVPGSIQADPKQLNVWRLPRPSRSRTWRWCGVSPTAIFIETLEGDRMMTKMSCSLSERRREVIPPCLAACVRPQE